MQHCKTGDEISEGINDNDRTSMLKHVNEESMKCLGIKGIGSAMVSGHELVGLSCEGRLTAVAVSLETLDRYLRLERREAIKHFVPKVAAQAQVFAALAVIETHIKGLVGGLSDE